MPSHDIKALAPKRNSRYTQGYVNPDECTKLFESQKGKPIIYRSSWELYFIKWCENNPTIKYWGSECVPIKYILSTDHSQHTYYPDYIIEFQNGECWLVEIKPLNQTKRPKNKKYNSPAWQTYIKNCCKWRAANEFAKHNNIKFKIITEKTINRL